MRAITKGRPHWKLDRRNSHPPTTAEEAEAAWHNFRSGKEGTRNKCFEEQFGLCAYSEIDLVDSGLGMHLDHVEPKSLNPLRTFDHNNLLLSAIDSDQLSRLAAQDVFGGHKRLNLYSVTDFINPLWRNSRDFFSYNSDGTISPASSLSQSDKDKAEYTINLLNLNAPLLVNRRRHWLEELEKEIGGLLHDWVAVQNFAEAELCATSGKLRQFHSAVRNIFGRLGEDVIRTNCPQCS
jgi:uncharacterized protein (TIGR02646 family)